MGRLTQQELEELVKKKKREKAAVSNIENRPKVLSVASSNKDTSRSGNKKTKDEVKLDDAEIKKIASEIMGEKPKSNYGVLGNEMNSGLPLIPKVKASDYPQINVKGIFPGYRQERGATLRILKEIDVILDDVVKGNKNASMNLLMWIGLQALKESGNKNINININASTFADGKIITEYQEAEKKV